MMNGCNITNAYVENSILGEGCILKEGCKVTNSVLRDGTVVDVNQSIDRLVG